MLAYRLALCSVTLPVLLTLTLSLNPNVRLDDYMRNQRPFWETSGLETRKLHGATAPLSYTVQPLLPCMVLPPLSYTVQPPLPCTVQLYLNRLHKWLSILG